MTSRSLILLFLLFPLLSFTCKTKNEKRALERANDSARIADSIYYAVKAQVERQMKLDSIANAARTREQPVFVEDSMHRKYFDTFYRLFDRSQSQPCTTLREENGVNAFRLMDSEAIHTYIGDQLPLHDLDIDHPYYECANASGTEILRFIFHEGGSYDLFNEMEVRPAAGDTADKTLEDATFISTEGIHLGMKRALVIDKAGDCFVSSGPAGNDSLVYTVKDDDLYFRYYVFKNDRLVYFRFGTIYP